MAEYGTVVDKIYELEDRIRWLEEALVALAKATAEWEGGSYDGGHYTSGRWRAKVLHSVWRVNADE